MPKVSKSAIFSMLGMELGYREDKMSVRQFLAAQNAICEGYFNVPITKPSLIEDSFKTITSNRGRVKK